MGRRRLRLAAAVIACTLVAGACGMERVSGGSGAGDASVQAATTVAPPPTAPTTTAPSPTTAPRDLAEDAPSEAAPGGMDAPELATLPDRSEPEVTVPAGPGVTTEVLASALAGIIAAEDAMAAFEDAWDEGMTYSETFRGWRDISAEVDAAFAAFTMPEDVDAVQLESTEAYLASVLGAQAKWQEVTEFIVTYITNYTPEILIQEAYRDVEDELEAALEQRAALLDA